MLDAVIADGYATGKLGYSRNEKGEAEPDALESMLRDLGSAKGPDAVKAKLTAMRMTIPVGQRQLTADIKEPAKILLSYDDAVDAQLQVAADQLGIPVEQLRAQRVRNAGAR